MLTDASMTKQKEHWAKRLKRERDKAQAELESIVLRPDSAESVMIMTRIKLTDGVRKAMLSQIWGGDYKSQEC